MNNRPLIPRHARPPRPLWQRRPKVEALIDHYIKGGKLKACRREIYLKIADLHQYCEPQYLSNLAIARFTFTDYGLCRSAATARLAKKDLENARLLIIVRGNGRRLRSMHGKGAVFRRPADKTQPAGGLAKALGYRNSWLPGVILCSKPFKSWVRLKDIPRLQVLREPKKEKLRFSNKDTQNTPKALIERFKKANTVRRDCGWTRCWAEHADTSPKTVKSLQQTLKNLQRLCPSLFPKGLKISKTTGKLEQSN